MNSFSSEWIKEGSFCAKLPLHYFSKNEFHYLHFRFLSAVEDVIRNARHLKHLSLGCIGELADHADQLLYLLQVKHFASLKALHISSVKEDPDSYGLIDIPAQTFHLFRNLSTLGIDYDYLSNQLLEGFVQGEKTRLEKLILHIHGVNAENEKILNTTWLKLVQANPNFEVTVNMIHSFDGSICMLDILQPALPLAHLRMFFCQQINEAAINFLSRHMANRLRSIYIIDGMEDGQPNVYDITTDEDPFVMLAWKCPNLTSFTLIGMTLFCISVCVVWNCSVSLCVWYNIVLYYCVWYDIVLYYYVCGITLFCITAFGMTVKCIDCVAAFNSSTSLMHFKVSLQILMCIVML